MRRRTLRFIAPPGCGSRPRPGPASSSCPWSSESASTVAVTTPARSARNVTVATTPEPADPAARVNWARTRPAFQPAVDTHGRPVEREQRSRGHVLGLEDGRVVGQRHVDAAKVLSPHHHQPHCPRPSHRNADLGGTQHGRGHAPPGAAGASPAGWPADPRPGIAPIVADASPRALRRSGRGTGSARAPPAERRPRAGRPRSRRNHGRRPRRRHRRRERPRGGSARAAASGRPGVRAWARGSPRRAERAGPRARRAAAARPRSGA
jgi:hypothetical protein